MPSSPYPSSSSTGAALLSTAPGSDTGQTAIAVRVVSQLGAGTGGGGGNLATAAKGTTAAGSPTSTATDANTQALHSYVVNLPTTQAVSGTFWQTTQPVSGTFWQSTQPVSIASMPSTPVTGTFFQATQPVSIAGTVATNTGLTQPLTDTQLRATAVPVSGTVSIGTTGTVAITNAAAVAKGTQGANAVPTQDLKDSGRVAISFTAEFSPVAVAETMLTMSVSKDGATATTGSSYIITSGKRLRICSKSIGVENTLGTSIQRAYLRTRFAATGGAVVASPLQANIAAAAAGTVKSMASNFDDYPDGMEFLGDGTRAIGWSLQAPDWVTASATLKVYVTVIGYEY